jgi:hypothetical protein
MVDIVDIIEFLRPRGLYRFMYASAGIEIRLLEVLNIRAGITGMLPSVGIGFDFMAFKLDAAFFMKDIGNDYFDFLSYGAALSILWRY